MDHISIRDGVSELKILSCDNGLLIAIVNQNRYIRGDDTAPWNEQRNLPARVIADDRNRFHSGGGAGRRRRRRRDNLRCNQDTPRRTSCCRISDCICEDRCCRRAGRWYELQARQLTYRQGFVDPDRRHTIRKRHSAAVRKSSYSDTELRRGVVGIARGTNSDWRCPGARRHGQMPRCSHRWRRIEKEPIDDCRYWRCGASDHNSDVAADLPYLVDAIKKAGQVLR